jgi:hypothetical protein
MKKYLLSLIALSMIVLVAMSSDSFAQRGNKGQGKNTGRNASSQYNRLYDKTTVETISGEVTAVETLTTSKVMRGGTHVMLKNEKETISIHLGPSWYLDKKEIKIAAGDKISVKGSRITFEGKPAIIASQVSKNNDVLKLRDDNGYPLWSGSKRK